MTAGMTRKTMRMIFTATTSATGKTRIMRRRGKNSMERIRVCQAQRVRIALVLDSLIVDIYRNNEYRKLADGENASEEEIAYKDFTLSVKKDGTSGNTIDPLKTSVRLWMTDDYKIKAVISDTVTADDKKEERCEKRLELEAAHSSESETVTVAGDDGDSDDDDSYTITTTTIITTIRWQNGTIEKELLQDDK